MGKTLSAAQEQARSERLARQSQPVPDNDEQVVHEASLAVMSGYTDMFRIGGKDYEIAKFAVTKIEEGYAKLYACPAILIVQALASKDGKAASLDTITAKFNEMLMRTGPENPDDPAYDPDTAPQSSGHVANILGNFPATLRSDPAIIDRLFEIVLFVLRRKHKDIQRTDIEDDFDVDTFIRFVRALFRVETGLKDSF